MKKRVLSEEIKLKVKAVIFDMDGVVTNTMPDHFRAWKEIFKREGIAVTREDIYSREGQRGMDSVKEIFRDYDKTVDAETARRILRDKEKFFKKIVKRRFIPGARSFLKWSHKSDFHLALVTGTARHEVYKILPMAIYSLFSVIITGSDVQNGKPHPEPFLKALEKLKIKASEAVVIENAPLGIRSAKKAGIACFALETSLSREYLKEADIIFSSFEALKRQVTFDFKD